jgi:hypothetical protein
MADAAWRKLTASKAMSLEASLNLTAVPLTAVMVGSRLISGSEAAAALLPASANADDRGLFFIHGYRHREEWRTHAAVLQLSPSAPLVNRWHLLLHNSDTTHPLRMLLRALAKYPQPTKFLVNTGANIGYRCGLLHSLATTRGIWERYEYVLFSHPDVFLFPPAPAMIDAQFTSARRFTNASLLVTATKMFWTNRRHFGKLAFLSDLFGFRPRLLAQPPPPPPPDSATVAPLSFRGSRSEFWGNASDHCSRSYWEGRGMVKPEQALAYAQGMFQAPTRPLLARTTGWKARRISSAGVWHSHNVSEVAMALRSAQGQAKARVAGAPPPPHPTKT